MSLPATGGVERAARPALLLRSARRGSMLALRLASPASRASWSRPSRTASVTMIATKRRALEQSSRPSDRSGRCPKGSRPAPSEACTGFPRRGAPKSFRDRLAQSPPPTPVAGPLRARVSRPKRRRKPACAFAHRATFRSGKSRADDGKKSY